MINPEEFKKLRQQFNKIDKNLSGTIETDELRDAVKNMDIELSAEEVEKIVKQCDYNEDGLINYHEFIAATFPVDKYLTKERMQALFHRFDVDD